MAYKFQIGAARLSGSIIQSDGSGDLRATTVDSLNASGGGIADAGVIAGASTISGSGALSVGSIANAEFTVDASGNTDIDGTLNVEGVPTFQAQSVHSLGATFAAGGLAACGAIAGATTVTATGIGDFGSLTIDNDSTIGAGSDADMLTLKQASKITVASDLDFVVSLGKLKIGADAVTSTAAEINLLDAMARGSILYGNSSAASAALAKGAASTFLQSDGNDIAYVAMSGDATLSAGAISIGATKVTDAMLNDDVATGLAGAGSTATSGVINVIGGDGITANANDIAVTAAQTTITSVYNAALVVGRNANNRVDFATDNFVKIYSNGAERLVINDTGNTIVKGDLLVEGTTTTIDSTTINVSRSLTFEGPASDFECIFGYGATDAPLQDISVILPEYSSSAGAHIVKAAVIADGGSAADYLAASLVKAAEFKLLDGATAASAVTVVSTDRVIFNDGGSMIQASMADIKTFVGSGASEAVRNLSSVATLQHGVCYYGSDITSTQTLGLPASAAMTVGQRIRIKAPSDCSNSVKVVINIAGSQTMDGTLVSISLESPFAAVELVYVAADKWRIF